MKKIPQMENFFTTISNFSNLSSESKSALASVLRQYEYPKGKILVKPDTTCNHFYFIERGLTRTYYFKEGKDITDWISAENSFAVSIISFITRKPDRRGIEVLEPSQILSMHFDDLENLCAKFHDVERLTRHLVSSGIVQLQRKFDELHFHSALERYESLMNTNPTFIQRVPLGMIASYLGITQETLSRIRAQI